MTLPFGAGALGYAPNIGRLIEDLTATLPTFASLRARGRQMHPPRRLLELLGEAYLGLPEPGDLTYILQSDPRPLAPLVLGISLPLLGGAVELNYLLAAVMFAAVADTLPRDAVESERALVGLRTLVLTTIDQNQLWPFVSARLVDALRRPSLADGPAGDGNRLISPLRLLFRHASPAQFQPPGLEATGTEAERRFNLWLAGPEEAAAPLFWLLTRRELSGRPPPRLNAASATIAWPDNAGDASGTSRREAPDGVALVAHGFGAEFPATRLTLGDIPRGHPTLRPVAPTLRGRAGVEIWAPQIALPLPVLIHPPSVLVLDLDIPPELCRTLWVEVALGTEVLDQRPAAAYRAGAARLLLARISRRLDQRLRLRFGFAGTAGPAPNDPPRLYSTLRMLMLWRPAA